MAKTVSEAAAAEQLTDDEIRQAAADIKSKKAELDETNGELRNLWKQFQEEKHGSNRVLKQAMKIADMVPTDAQEHLRLLHRYLTALGVYDQQDAFDATPDIRQKEATTDQVGHA